MLNGIWKNDEKQDKNKWENMFAPLAYGNFGNRLLVTTQMDLIAMIIAKVIKKKEIFRVEGLEEDKCLQLLNSHPLGIPSPRGKVGTAFTDNFFQAGPKVDGAKP
ncbi:hypothetical protein IEQ34_013497 [Dendrobium chrysotoxum]|uniref:Uncharacterized protein n=1 Tax=Dendrobium chrysotoxum TaxID=161865 RepID=A0AAV7GQ26_DENCH|nr:hypothetical protein IEQ34_013497 [Dendrobium chrysotoxum]